MARLLRCSPAGRQRTQTQHRSTRGEACAQHLCPRGTGDICGTRAGARRLCRRVAARCAPRGRLRAAVRAPRPKRQRAGSAAQGGTRALRRGAAAAVARAATRARARGLLAAAAAGAVRLRSGGCCCGCCRWRPRSRQTETRERRSSALRCCAAPAPAPVSINHSLASSQPHFPFPHHSTSTLTRVRGVISSHSLSFCARDLAGGPCVSHGAHAAEPLAAPRLVESRDTRGSSSTGAASSSAARPRPLCPALLSNPPRAPAHHTLSCPLHSF